MASGTFYPAVSGDDGRCFTAGGGFNIVGDYGVVGDISDVDYRSFVRFPSITIPQSSTIISAFIRFTAYSTASGTVVRSNIYFNDVDNAVAPADDTQLLALGLTSPIAWDSLPTWTDGVQYDTSELKTILQPVVDRAGFIHGGALTVVIEDDGSTSNKNRLFSSINLLAGAEKAELHVSYIGFDINLPTWNRLDKGSLITIDETTYLTATHS